MTSTTREEPRARQIGEYAPLGIHFDDSPANAWMELDELGLQGSAIVYCNRLRTDGFVPEAQLKKFGASGKGPRVVRRLLERGKWTRGERDGEPGYWITGFLDHNPSRAEIEERIAATKARATHAAEERWRRDREARARDAPSNASGMQPASNTQCTLHGTALQGTAQAGADAPAQPAPPPRSKPTRAQKRPLPVDWQPRAATATWALEQRVDLDRLLPEFRDYWLGRGDAYADWDAVLRNRVRDLLRAGRAPLAGEPDPPQRPSGVIPLHRGKPPRQAYVEPKPGEGGPPDFDPLTEPLPFARER